MADTIQITITSGARVDGLGGTIVLNPIAVIPDGMASEVAQAFDEKYGQLEVPNPAYDPNLPEDPVTNPKTIVATPEENFTYQIRRFTESVWSSWRVDKAKKTAESTERETIKKLQESVIIIQDPPA